jgi:MinD superfamily P-loop ATPase
MLKLIFNILFPPRSIDGETEQISCAEDKCTLCGKCQNICPAKAISVDKRSWIYYSYRCVHCGYCVMKCPVRALDFTKKETAA